MLELASSRPQFIVAYSCQLYHISNGCNRALHCLQKVGTVALSPDLPARLYLKFVAQSQSTACGPFRHWLWRQLAIENSKTANMIRIVLTCSKRFHSNRYRKNSCRIAAILGHIESSSSIVINSVKTDASQPAGGVVHLTKMGPHTNCLSFGSSRPN
jgi:hypothetical protein